MILRAKLAYHTVCAWHLNKRAAKASQDLIYSDHKSKASRVLREAGIRSNIHEAECIYLRARIRLEE